MQKTYQRLRYLLNRLPVTVLRVDRARSKAAIRTQRFSDRVCGGHSSNSVEDGLVALDAAKGALQHLREEIAFLQAKVKPHIDAMQNPTAQEVMKMRYLQGISAREIGWRIGYSEQHIYRLIRDGEKTAL